MRCESLEEPYKVRFSNGVVEAVCDATVDKGGRGGGFRPHDLLEAALGSCTAMVLSMYARTHGIPLEGATVTVTLSRDEPGVTAFAYDIELRGDLDANQRKRLLRAVRACPVRKTLSNTIIFSD